MISQKSLHKSDDPISSLHFGADSLEGAYQEVELVTCPHCQRHFSKDRIEKHKSVC